MKEGIIMSIISGWSIANSFLEKSFEEKIYITPLKLNCLVYLLYSDYLFSSGEILLNEPFVKAEQCPILPTIESKFRSFKNKVIKKYAKNAAGNIMVATGKLFEERLSYIWNNYKNMSDIEILTFINDTSSLNNKKNNDIISDIEILDDEIKRNETALEKAKCYRKKLSKQ